MTIRQRRVGGQSYYYLEHAVRKGARVEKREHYLGKRLPKDIEKLKRAFLHELYKERWHPALERIRKGFMREMERTPPSAREEEARRFTTHFTYDTQRIEGSTLSLRETSDLLERGITPSRARPLRDVKEAEAHRDVFEEMLRTAKPLSLSLVLHWHYGLFHATRPDIAGRVREHQVAISGSRFRPPSPVEVHPLLKDFFRWFGRNRTLIHPVELAALAHLKFVTIHPFADGNGRISRLLMNFLLHRAGYPLLNIHYEGRNSYYRALERAQTTGMDFVFVQWFLKRYVKENEPYAEARRG